MLRSTDLLALPAVDCDKAYAMQLSLEETLLTTQTVYFQVALLYPLPDITDNYEFACLLSCHSLLAIDCMIFKAQSIICFIRKNLLVNFCHLLV